MQPNSTKTNPYLSLGSNGVDRVRSLRKIPMRLNGTNLSINGTSSTRSAPSFSNKTLANAPKHYENAPKHEFRVQWGGSHAFIAKNSDVSSWHELLH